MQFGCLKLSTNQTIQMKAIAKQPNIEETLEELTETMIPSFFQLFLLWHLEMTFTISSDMSLTFFHIYIAIPPQIP